MTPIIHLERLTKSYGVHRGITDLDLDVAEGEIFGFLGPNGAGKTTTMRVLLDLIRPTAGRAEVFGIETTRDPVAIHRRVGYLPGEFDLYDRLTGADTIDYFANLRGGVDRRYVGRAHRAARSRPEPAVQGVLARQQAEGRPRRGASARPDLLILDEPTSGLDPLIQQTFYGILREARDDGGPSSSPRTSSTRSTAACDRVAIIREGRLVQVDRIEAIRRLAFHHVELTFGDRSIRPCSSGSTGSARSTPPDSRVSMRVAGPIGAVLAAAAPHGLVDVVSREPNLEDVFLAQYGRGPATTAGATDGR